MSERGALGRFVARLTGRWHLERLAELEEKVVSFGRSQREALAAQRQQLVTLQDAVETRASTAVVRGLDQRVRDIQVSLAHQDRAFAEALERARVFDEQGRDNRRFARRVEAMLRRDYPIVVGPWTGEVGFELLYWIPFIRWVVDTYGVPPERLFVISRGGVASWYGGLAARYADVFSSFSPEEFQAGTQAMKKQRLVGAFDAEALKRVTDTHGIGRSDLLHPGMMYRLLMPFWKESSTVARVDKYSTYARIEPGDDAVLRDLPADYVAARFYFSDCFPDTPSNRNLVATVLTSISRDRPVVLLNMPFVVDDHRDAASAGGRIVTIGSAHLSPERNLAVQTAVIARARSFVGTYGGYSYLAPFCGVPALAFYSRPSFQRSHLEVARRAFEHLGGASLVPIDVHDLPMLGLALPESAPTT